MQGQVSRDMKDSEERAMQALSEGIGGGGDRDDVDMPVMHRQDGKIGTYASAGQALLDGRIDHTLQSPRGMGLALGVQGGTSRTQPSDANSYVSGLRGNETAQAESRSRLVQDYRCVVCYGYVMDVYGCIMDA